MAHYNNLVKQMVQHVYLEPQQEKRQQILTRNNYSKFSIFGRTLNTKRTQKNLLKIKLLKMSKMSKILQKSWMN